MSTNRKLSSTLSPIRDIEALSRMLQVDAEELIRIANSSESFWKPGARLPKKESSEIRQTNDAKEPLKSIHDRINKKLLIPFLFPSYLHGSIHDPSNPRSPISNAAEHTGKKVIIQEDIAAFFPNTTTGIVSGIWRYCFHFSPEVADILTKLTIYKGNLPQGWRTSSYLANLAFWDREPELVADFRASGLTYTRYVDDITVSAPRHLSKKEKTRTIGRIYGMLTSKGYRPKREKQKIATNNQPMEVTGIRVNTKKPTLPKQYQKNVRAEVHSLENAYKIGQNDSTYDDRWNSTYGKVRRIASMNPNKGKQLEGRLNKIQPRN